MPIYALGDLEPRIHPEAYVHPDAVVIGDVEIGARSTVWPGAVLRGDDGAIRIGTDTSIQDGAILHTTPHRPTVVGDACVIGHLAHLEGCTIHDRSLVGSGAIVLHRSEIGPDALVAAAALVGNDRVVPPLHTALGVPFRLREGVDTEDLARGAASYVARGVRFQNELRRIDPTA